MYKVKTFTTSLEIFKTQGELDALDRRVNDFLAAEKNARPVSVSDATTTDSSGTIGLVRVVTYECD